MGSLQRQDRDSSALALDNARGGSLLLSLFAIACTMIGCGGSASPPLTTVLATGGTPGIRFLSANEWPGIPVYYLGDSPLAVPSHPDQIMLREWESGALRAAEELGCSRVVWQLPGETLKQAVAVYAHGYVNGSSVNGALVKGDCLILLPHQGGTNFYLGWAGQYDQNTEKFFAPKDYMLKEINDPVVNSEVPGPTRDLVPEIASSELEE